MRVIRIQFNRITHLGRMGLIAVGWVRHKLLYELVPEAS